MALRESRTIISSLLAASVMLLILAGSTFSQSNSRDFPTPVRSNEISGTIRARDLGDPRRTTYYFAFNGQQGDIFINVVTKNFDGDIDVFTADTLKPLTKIVIYSDSPDNETGRVIYLRQPEKLILRIEGRTATDEQATFRIKFAGSFAPASGIAESEEPKLPTVKPDPDAEVKVNSVGTIVAVKPKPTPTPKVETVPEQAKPAREKPKRADEETAERRSEKPESAKPEVVVTDDLPKPDTDRESKVVEPKPKPKTPPKKVPATPAKRTPANAKKTPAKTEETVPAPDPLANVRLVILFKDGSKVERPMTEVLRIVVDKSILTIIHKDGSIGRYPLIDVARFAIE